MALEGTLRDFSLADIFQLIGLQRKTGVLTLRSAEDTITVSFLDGKVVGAESERKKLEDRLGQVLRRSGLVSQAQLDAALRSQMETLERLGHALIRLGALSRDELSRALEQQVLQIIYRTFRWQDGEYQFSQETSIDYDAEYVTPISSESILMEGARMLDEWPIIEKKIPNWNVVFRQTPAAAHAEIATQAEAENLEDFEFEVEPPAPAPGASGKVLITAAEQEVLRLVDGVTSVDEIVRRSIFGEFETCKALYTLLMRSLIREASRDELVQAAQARSELAIELPAKRPRRPWLALALLPILVASLLLAPRNPFNIWAGPSPKLLQRVTCAQSAARMWNLWQTLHARETLLGTYPETLTELVRENMLGEPVARDPWGRPYRYALREQSLLIAGSTPDGAPDPDLIIIQYLGGERDDAGPGHAVTLLNP